MLDAIVSRMKACSETMLKPVGRTGVSSLVTLGSVGSEGVSAGRFLGDLPAGGILETASMSTVLALLEALRVESLEKETSSSWLCALESFLRCSEKAFLMALVWEGVNSVQVEHGCSSLQRLWRMQSRWRSQLAIDLLQDKSPSWWPHLLFLLDLGSVELL